MSQEEANHEETNKRVVFEGTVGEVVHDTQPNGKIYETYRRPPGTRVIVVNDQNEILMTREYRQESGEVDLRLPGGKVFNTMKEMNHFLKTGGVMEEAILSGARLEARQEGGVVLDDAEIVAKAIDGTTVDWDLYYVMSRNHDEHPEGQDLEEGEEGITTGWMPIPEIIEAIERGEMHEWRSVGILLGKILPMLTK